MILNEAIGIWGSDTGKGMYVDTPKDRKGHY